MNNTVDSDESGCFLDCDNYISNTASPENPSEELYKYIPPPIPLVPKNLYADNLPRCHQDMLLLPRLSGSEEIFSQGPEVSPSSTVMIPQVSLITMCESRSNNIVYRRDSSTSGLPYNANLLDLHDLIKSQETSRPDPVKFDNEIQPFYKPNLDDSTLVFESRFESGNLAMAMKMSNNEYNLILQNDINTRGHTQWFYFRVTNTTAELKVKFNILNLTKKDSLYNEGMKILIFSENESQTNNVGWFRGGYDIMYHANGIRKPKGNKTFYTLTWKYDFPYSKDTVYFAYSYPYTYTDLMHDLQILENNAQIQEIMARRLLCYTISGNRCEYLTITAQGTPEQTKKRKGVVISARAHPGESVGSWMMKGVIDFLTSQAAEARLLREAFVFKLIPMMNPDGVINGNYRCNLAGVDLNRRWKDPSKTLQPTVYYAKRLIKSFGKERPLELVCDFHGHSRRKNIFMYGCNYPDRPEATRTFPFILSKVSPFFSYSYCSFRMQKSKESTLRISMFKETRTQNVYTLEASFCGPNFGPFIGSHHTAKQLQEMGKQVCLSLAINAEIELPLALDPQPSPDGEIANLATIKKKDILTELLSTKELLVDNPENDSSGSDSEPSEDNLDPEEMAEVLPTTSRKRIDKKRPVTTKKRNSSNLSINLLKEKEKELQKCGTCGELLKDKHVCKTQAPKPKPRFSQIYKKPTSIFSVNQPYYNAAGKKVRDQATQTMRVPQNPVEDIRTQSPILSSEFKEKITGNLINRNRSVSQKPATRDYKNVNRSFNQNYGEKPGVWKMDKQGLPSLGKLYDKSMASPAWKISDMVIKKH
ncbi:unnamed protein product [Blepharisma stoltei]|uniref:Peptidase M14 domain-containing protein n=1 Tax=Blepharisma stoltei TaxID=1481888 RepID=A0AAU9K3J4_9CILI|nr:unnamed protein product [Blepharisma stoltei]